MVGMRFSSSGRNNRNSRLPIVYYVCEGMTEMEYMQRFHEEMGHFTPKPVPKDGIDENLSDRKDLVLLLFGYVQYHVCHRVTPFWFAKSVLDEFKAQKQRYFKEKHSVKSAKSWNYFDKDMWEIRREAADIAKTSEDGTITNREETLRFIRSKLKEKHSTEVKSFRYRIQDYDPGSKSNVYEKGLDRMIAIYDRDLDTDENNKIFHRRDEDYDELISLAESLGIETMLTTPRFELWLYMHHDDADLEGVGRCRAWGDEIEEKLYYAEHPGEERSWYPLRCK